MRSGSLEDFYVLYLKNRPLDSLFCFSHTVMCDLLSTTQYFHFDLAVAQDCCIFKVNYQETHTMHASDPQRQ